MSAPGDPAAGARPEDARRRVLVAGRVQGVGFRAHARAEGERLGLAGWVRNRRDGRVEALVAGPPAAVAAFTAWCREQPRGTSPFLARVDRVDEGPGDPAPGDPAPPLARPFAVAPTA